MEGEALGVGLGHARVGAHPFVKGDRGDDQALVPEQEEPRGEACAQRRAAVGNGRLAAAGRYGREYPRTLVPRDEAEVGEGNVYDGADSGDVARVLQEAFHEFVGEDALAEPQG